MNHLGFKPCLADPDLWMMAMVCPLDGSKYYADVLIYLNDVMVIPHDAEAVLLCISKYFKMKPGSIGDPKPSRRCACKMAWRHGLVALQNMFQLWSTLSRSISQI
jgi:hypothetical protein